MDRYIRIFQKRNIMVGLICALLVFVPLFVVSLVYDVVPKDTLISFGPFLLAAICVALASLCTIQFRKLIKAQEKLYNIEFQDTNVQHLETTLYLSDHWLIWAGVSAFYKPYIKSIKAAHRFGRAGSSYAVILQTVDDKKYTIWCLSNSNVNKIQKWNNEK